MNVVLMVFSNVVMNYIIISYNAYLVVIHTPYTHIATLLVVPLYCSTGGNTPSYSSCKERVGTILYVQQKLYCILLLAILPVSVVEMVLYYIY